MNKWLPPLLLCLAGCAQGPSETNLVPTSTHTVLPSPTPKPTATPIPPPPTPEIFRALSRDGRYEATGFFWNAPGHFDSVEVRDAKTMRLLKTWRPKDGVTGLSFSPDGTRLVVNQSVALTIWDWRVPKLVHTEPLNRGEGANVRISSDFSPNGRWLVASDNNGILIYDTRSWRKRKIELPFVTHVVFTPDSRFVVASQWDSSVAYSLIPVRGKNIRGIPSAGPPYNAAQSLGDPLFSRDGKLMVLGIEGESNRVEVWSVPRVRLLRKFALPEKEGDYFYPTAISPNARYLASLGEDEDQKGLISVQRLSDGKRVFSVKQECDSLSWVDNKTLELRVGQATKRLSITGVAR